MTSLTMMAMVRPTRAIDRSWWRPAKASSSSRFTEVGHGPEGGRGLSHSRRGGRPSRSWDLLQPRASAPSTAKAGGEEVRLRAIRSEEHTSELQSLMRISYAVFCLKKKKSIQSKLREHTYTN